VRRLVGRRRRRRLLRYRWHFRQGSGGKGGAGGGGNEGGGGSGGTTSNPGTIDSIRDGVLHTYAHVDGTPSYYLVKTARMSSGGIYFYTL
jgi:hypothetical protein